MDPTFLLKQYEILWDTFNNEMQRFWRRFNILIGIEVAAGYGVLKLLPTLTDDGLEKGIVFLVMSFFSILTCLIVWRAISVYKLLGLAILDIESDNDELFLANTLQRVSKDNQILGLGTPHSMIYSLIIAIIFAVMWLFGFLFSLFQGT